jgi:glycosyltransferase involved in cell wall biosynthesis
VRILFLSNYYPPHHIGGYEELSAEVAGGLQAMGHEVIVLTSRAGVKKSEHEAGIYRLLYNDIDNRPFKAAFDFFAQRDKYIRANITYFRSIVNKFHPDIILVWGMWNLPRALLVVAEAEYPDRIVYYMADYWPSLPSAFQLYWQEPARHSGARIIKASLSRMAINKIGHEAPLPQLKFKHTLCVSNYVRETLVKPGIIPDSSRVIHNGINLAEYNDSKENCDKSSNPEPVKLLYAGRLSPDKGAHIAVEAFSILVRKGYNVALTIVGTGSSDYLRQLEMQINKGQFAADVNMMGRVPREKMPDIIRQHDILLVPSVWPDPMPRVIQEAMAAGTAVVASDIGGIPEIIQDGENGLLFPIDDTNVLVEKLKILINQPGLMQRIASAGHETVRSRFDITHTVGQIDTYIKDLIQ